MADNYIVEGFDFYTAKHAEMAMQEQKKIDYLEEKINYDNPDAVLKLYRRMIQERVFKTPIGIIYLRNMQQYLQTQESINPEEIIPIPLYFTYETEVREHTSPARKRIEPSKKKEKKLMALPLSITLNIALTVAIVAMFIIALNSSQPNILNYERNLVDKYASWEQDLTEREQELRERELKLLQAE